MPSSLTMIAYINESDPLPPQVLQDFTTKLFPHYGEVKLFETKITDLKMERAKLLRQKARHIDSFSDKC